MVNSHTDTDTLTHFSSRYIMSHLPTGFSTLKITQTVIIGVKRRIKFTKCDMHTDDIWLIEIYGLIAYMISFCLSIKACLYKFYRI